LRAAVLRAAVLRAAVAQFLPQFVLPFAPQSVLLAAQRMAPQRGPFGKVRQRRFETLLLDCLDVLASARNK
jgi:hypothetical protein